MNLYLISYDISKDRKRTIIANVISNYGCRVQYSVFECYLSLEQFKKLIEELKEKFSNEEQDSIRIYRLCKKCEKNKNVLGYHVNVKKYFQEENPIVI